MYWFNNLKIRTKMLVSMLTTSLIIVATGTTLTLFHMNGIRYSYNVLVNHPIAANMYSLHTQSYIRGIQISVSNMAMQALLNNPDEVEALWNDAQSFFWHAMDSIDNAEYAIDVGIEFSSTGVVNSLGHISELRILVQQYFDTVATPVHEHSANNNSIMATAIIENGYALINELIELTYTLSDSFAFLEERHSSTVEAYFRSSIAQFLTLSAVSIALVLLIINFLANSVSKPVKRLVSIANSIVSGDLNPNVYHHLETKDEIGVLAKDFHEVVHIIQNLATDLDNLTYNANTLGDIEYRIDSNKYFGKYKDIIESINLFTSKFVEDMHYTIAIIDFINKGDFNMPVKQLSGKKILLTHKFEELLRNLKDINTTIISVANETAQGNLNSHVNETEYSGGWKDSISALNSLVNSIATPFEELQQVLSKMAEGDFSHMQGSYHGEFEKAKNNANKTIENMSIYINEISFILSKISDKDLTHNPKETYIGNFSHIKESLNNILAAFNGVMNDISAASNLLSETSRMISDDSISLSANTQEQSSILHELEASVVRINNNYHHISEKIKETNELCSASQGKAHAGNEDMQRLQVSMQGIKKYSNKIIQVTQTIEGIAFQTNLLAINASVEAARAGEMGKGFGVVAEEVRSLAKRSQEAAKQTAELIAETIRRVEEGTNLTEQTALSLNNIVEDIAGISDIIKNIYEVTESQVSSFDGVVSDITQISDSVSQDALTSQKNASSSEELARQAEIMRNHVLSFNITN